MSQLGPPPGESNLINPRYLGIRLQKKHFFCCNLSSHSKALVYTVSEKGKPKVGKAIKPARQIINLQLASAINRFFPQ